MAKPKDENGSTKVERPTASLGAEARKALFAKYDIAEKAVSAAKSDLEKKIEMRGAVVKEIAQGCGTGPFRTSDGRILSVVVRSNKENPENPTYFFKGPKESDVVDI